MTDEGVCIYGQCVQYGCLIPVDTELVEFRELYPEEYGCKKQEIELNNLQQISIDRLR